MGKIHGLRRQDVLVLILVQDVLVLPSGCTSTELDNVATYVHVHHTPSLHTITYAGGANHKSKKDKSFDERAEQKMTPKHRINELLFTVSMNYTFLRQDYRSRCYGNCEEAGIDIIHTGVG